MMCTNEQLTSIIRICIWIEYDHISKNNRCYLESIFISKRVSSQSKNSLKITQKRRAIISTNIGLWNR